jgi:hypothetical protein
MQIDYHHAATYICCRLAGMSSADAAIVAHASQYVDDATNDGPLAFSSGERYVRVTSAHKTLDIRLNADAKDNRLVWVPFHFLPGNDQAQPGQDAAGAFMARMVCRPNSVIANEMVNDAITRQDLPFALHRFGIALHTYIDTWAHQGFAGMIDDFNRVAKITIVEDPVYANDPIFGDLTSATTKITALVANHLPVGHAGVVTMPDLPFLRWSFRRESGEHVARDNPAEFMEAATHMFNAARRYVAQDTNLAAIDLLPADKAEVARLTLTTLAIDGEQRHPVWLQSIAQGAFSFGAEQVSYIESGPGSWKYTALGADPDAEDGTEEFEYSPAFLTSNWKRFHDAVQYQRLFILHDLLPRHGIVAS